MVPTATVVEVLGYNSLSVREIEMLGWVLRGKTYEQVAVKMGTTEGTVKQRASAIRDKMGCHSMIGCAVKGVLCGLVGMPELWEIE